MFVNGGGGLFRLGVDGGELEPIAVGQVQAINNDHVLSPDGALMYVSSVDGHIYAVSLEGDAARRVTNDHETGFRHYLHGVSPDGRYLAYIGMQNGADGVITNVYSIPSIGGGGTHG